MKKFLTIVALAVTFVTHASNRENPNEVLTVEGKFMAQKHVNYKVYEFMADGTLKQVYQDQGTQYFNFNVVTGSKYVVRFISLNNEVKSLFINAEESGTFQLIVDFNKSNAGVLKYNSKKSVYELKSIPITNVNEKRQNHRS